MESSYKYYNNNKHSFYSLWFYEFQSLCMMNPDIDFSIPIFLLRKIVQAITSFWIRSSYIAFVGKQGNEISCSMQSDALALRQLQ